MTGLVRRRCGEPLLRPADRPLRSTGIERLVLVKAAPAGTPPLNTMSALPQAQPPTPLIYNYTYTHSGSLTKDTRGNVRLTEFLLLKVRLWHASDMKSYLNEPSPFRRNLHIQLIVRSEIT